MPLELINEDLTPSRPATRSVVTLSVALQEGETGVYVVQLRGPGAAIIANTDFTAIELTLIDEQTHTVINSRSDQDVLNASGDKLGQNDVVIGAAALLTWSISALDNVIADPTGRTTIEWHRAIFKLEFDVGDGAEVSYHEVRYPVRQSFRSNLQTIA